MKLTTTAGVELDSETFSAPSLTDWARKWGIKDIIVFTATFPDKAQEYLVVRDQTPVYASQSMEAVACWIDATAMSEGRTRL
jgi:hypothetical protein